MSEYLSPYSPKLIGRSGQDRVLYRDYLQSKSFATDVTASVEQVNYSISKSSREMIGTLEQLHERGYEMLSATSDLNCNVKHGFESVTWHLDDISGELTELNAKFDWGFSQMIAGIGRVNDSLKQLISIAKTPAETWAYNQYEIARDAIRRELYPEAVESLLRAVNGYGDHVGYKLEYRFHYTLGILQLGDINNTDATVLDLAKSEASFLVAARYAKADFPIEASLALTAAGWAAFCQDKLSEAENHTKQAVALNRENGEAFYQLAKFQMHSEKPKEAISNLRRAVVIDRHYTVKAATDLDFLKFENELQQLLDLLRLEAKCKAEPIMAKAENVLKNLNDWNAEATSINKSFRRVRKNFDSNTYFGFVDAETEAQLIISLGTSLLKQQQLNVTKDLSKGINGLRDFQNRFCKQAMENCPREFQNAVEMLDQVGCEVQSLADYFRKMDSLIKTREQFQATINLHQVKFARRKKTGIRVQNIEGALTGMLIAIIPALLVSAITAAIIVAFKELDGTRSNGQLFGYLMAILTGICLIMSALVGAQKQKNKFLRNNEFDFHYPPLPTLTLVGNTNTPSSLPE